MSAHPQWGRFRDMFVLGCYTGLRFSDFSVIRPEDIRQGMLYKKQGKSDHWVVIPLRPEAYDILINRFNKRVPKTTNTPPELIMKISGHRGLKDFYKYIRITPEEAGRKIQEIWEKRGEMTPAG